MTEAARAIYEDDPGWKDTVRLTLLDEFPGDMEMLRFAQDKFSDIVRLLMDGKRQISIRRSLSHGLELISD
ncbi:MAG: hypothetical protein V1809_00300 [Planctomycetota bacterium]